MQNWLIRTKQNQILGPMERSKVLEFLEKGDLKDDDEMCSGNGYWFYVRETDLVSRYLYDQEPQKFNPISEAQTVLANHPNIDQLLPKPHQGPRAQEEKKKEDSRIVDPEFSDIDIDIADLKNEVIRTGDEYLMNDVTSANLTLDELEPAKVRPRYRITDEETAPENTDTFSYTEAPIPEKKIDTPTETPLEISSEESKVQDESIRKAMAVRRESPTANIFTNIRSTKKEGIKPNKEYLYYIVLIGLIVLMAWGGHYYYTQILGRKGLFSLVINDAKAQEVVSKKKTFFNSIQYPSNMGKQDLTMISSARL